MNYNIIINIFKEVFNSWSNSWSNSRFNSLLHHSPNTALACRGSGGIKWRSLPRGLDDHEHNEFRMGIIDINVLESPYYPSRKVAGSRSLQPQQYFPDRCLWNRCETHYFCNISRLLWKSCFFLLYHFRYQTLDTRFWLPDSGYQIWVTGSWLPDRCYQILATRY